jgi:flagellar protein FliO/FliZ
MELADFTRFIFSLGLVIGLIWLTAFLFRRFGLDKKQRSGKSIAGKIEVVDTLYLDPRRKLVVVRYDARDYLLLLTSDSAVQLLPQGGAHAA